MVVLTIYSEGSRRLGEAAELALEMLARRDELAAVSERLATVSERNVSTEGVPDQVVDDRVSYE